MRRKTGSSKKSPKLRPKRKVSHRKLQSTPDSRHWLQRESNSDEELEQELDPFLYVVDDLLHRVVNSAAHSYDGNEKRPKAVFLPVSESIGWQVAYIAKSYNTYLLADHRPRGFDDASDLFSIQFMDFDEFDRVDYWVDLFVSTSYSWSSAHEFFTFMNANLGLLSPEGRAYAVLPGSAPLTLEDDLDIKLEWFDGSYCSVSDLISCRWFEGGTPVVERALCFPSIDPRDPSRLSAFAKRNKKFFGAELQPTLLKQLDDPKVNRLFEPKDSEQDCLWAVLLCWKSLATY